MYPWPLGIISASGGIDAIGEQVFLTSDIFTVPENVYRISIVSVGAGSGSRTNALGAYASAGGGLAWKNNVPVNPGDSVSVVVGASSSGGVGGASYVSINSTTVCEASGGNVATAAGASSTGGAFVTGDGGGGGFGFSTTLRQAGGAGAAGYGEFGGGGGRGAAGSASTSASGFTFCSSTRYNVSYSFLREGGNGGGVHLYGAGANGVNGLFVINQFGANGGNGSVLPNMISTYAPGWGARLDGASANTSAPCFSPKGIQVDTRAGGNGGVRIMWGGGRTFPSNAGAL